MKIKKNYHELAKVIAKHSGGKSNIKECYHCMSRLRLELRDTSIVKLDVIKNLGFIDALINGTQLQVIAGAEVYELYDAMTEYLGEEVKHGTVDEDGTNVILEEESKEKKKRTLKDVVFSIAAGISGVMQPYIPVLIAAGMLKGVYLILWQVGILSDTSSTYQVLSFACDAAFYFMPVFIGFNTARKYGGNPMLGALLGVVLVHPNFVAMVNEGAAISFLGIPVRLVGYSSTVLPALISVWIMCHVQKFFANHSPDIARVVIEPFCTFAVMLPLTLCVFAPLGDYVGIGLTVVLEWIYKTAGPLAPAIVGALIPFLVLTGTHLLLGPLAMMTMAATGIELILMPVATLHNFIHGAVDFGIGLKAKDKEVKSTALSCSFTSLIAGISEPSLYGICLKDKAAMIALIAGQFVGGLYFGITHTGIYTMPGAGLTFLGLAIYIGENPSNLINAIIGHVIGMGVAFVLAYVFHKDKNEA